MSELATVNAQITELVGEIRHDREIATEVLGKLGDLITSEDNVTFNLPGASVSAPSLKQLRGFLESGDLPIRITGVEGKVGDVEKLAQGLVQVVTRLSGDDEDAILETPYYKALDLKKNTDGATGNPLFRSQVEQGIRLPYAGYNVKPIDRKFETDADKIGDWLLPEHSETIDQRYTSVSYGSTVNVNQYQIQTGTRTYTRTYYGYRYYWGYYYYWWRYYYGWGWYRYTQTHVVKTYDNLTGSRVGQTFTVDRPRVIKGINIECVAPGSYRVAAKPRLVLMESSFGRPDMNQILCRGVFREDAAFANTGTTTVSDVIVDLERPVLLKPGKSYSFAILAEATFNVCVTANQDATGGLHYTQDGYGWDVDIAKDIAYKLRFADFGESAREVIINLDALELSGGIASATEQITAEIPDAGKVEIQFELNGNWYPLSQLNEITSLPPFTPLRAKLTGDQFAMPLIDTTQSSVTAFRPDTNGRYFSREFPAPAQRKVVYELIGFDEVLHSFEPALVQGGQKVTPSLVEVNDSSDGNVRSVTAVYDLDTSQPYSHDIKYGTQTAAQIFDVSSVIELNT